MTDVVTLIGALFILAGSFLCFSAALSLITFPDLLSKMHAITKPQSLGMSLFAVGITLALQTWWVFGVGLLIVLFQLLTSPVSATMVSRAAYRSGIYDAEGLVVDQLARDLELAGFESGTGLKPGESDVVPPRWVVLTGEQEARIPTNKSWDAEGAEEQPEAPTVLDVPPGEVLMDIPNVDPDGKG